MSIQPNYCNAASAARKAPRFRGVQPQDYGRMQQAIGMTDWAIDNNRFPIAAKIIDPWGREVASTTNRELDPSFPLGGTPIAHAEVSAIVEACKRLGVNNLKGYRMITTCEPCPMCLGAMYWAGIKEFVYANSIQDTARLREHGFHDKFFYNDMKKPVEQRSMPGYQISRDNAFAVLQRWDDKIQAQGKYWQAPGSQPE